MTDKFIPNPDADDYIDSEELSYDEVLLAEAESINSINKLILGEFNLATLLKDMLDHKDQLEKRQAYLAWLLRNVNIDNLADCHVVSGVLQDSDTFYAAMTDDDPTPTQTQTLVALEAAINMSRMDPDIVITPDLYQDMLEMHLLKTINVEDELSVGATLDIDPEFGFDTTSLQVAYGDSYKDHITGQWATRSCIAQWLESVQNSFRLSAQFNVSLDEGLCVIKLGAIYPNSMCIATSDKTKQINLAKRYAVAQCIRAGKCALVAPGINSVLIETHAPRKDNALLTCVVNDLNLEELTSVALGVTPLEDCEYLTFELDDEGWFVERDTSIDFEDKLFIPTDAYTPLTTNTSMTQDLLDAGYAKHANDFRINSKDMLFYTYDNIKDKLENSTEQAVSCLVETKKNTHDSDVEESCNRVMQGLIQGDIDITNKELISNIFLQGTQIDIVRRHIEEVLTDVQKSREMGEMPDFTKFPQVLDEVETTFNTISETGIYEDNDTCVYRWFESLASRITYNKLHQDDKREVVLVPNSYYHLLQSHIVFCLLTHDFDRALSSVEEVLRIAPTSVDAVLITTKYFEAISKPFRAMDEARSLLGDTLDYKSSAFILYRLAFLQWQLGDIKLATALYTQILNWPTTGAQENAAMEINELFDENDNYADLTVSQLREYANKKGYITYCDKGGEEILKKCVVLALDENLFDLSAALMVTLKENGPNPGSDILKAIMYSILPKDFKIERSI